MRMHITRALYAAVAAAITLGTLGFAGAGSAATAAPGSISPPEYSPSWAGYSVGGGRWFRFISTTLTVPAVNGGRSSGSLTASRSVSLSRNWR